MADNSTMQLQAQDKKEVTSPAEKTRSGVYFTPPVDIFETEQALTVIADLPGVTKENLEIDLRKNVLTLVGNPDTARGSDEGDIHNEYRTGGYMRQFTLSEAIDQSAIEATLKEGVLRLVLPKVAKAVPRKIEVQAG